MSRPRMSVCQRVKKMWVYTPSNFFPFFNYDYLNFFLVYFFFLSIFLLSDLRKTGNLLWFCSKFSFPFRCFFANIDLLKHYCSNLLWENNCREGFCDCLLSFTGKRPTLDYNDQILNLKTENLWFCRGKEFSFLILFHCSTY